MDAIIRNVFVCLLCVLLPRETKAATVGNFSEVEDFCVKAINMQRIAATRGPTFTALNDCCDAFLLSGRTGVYWYRSVGKSQRLFCDMDTAGGGWIVFGRRFLNLNYGFWDKTWEKYVKGFGLLDKEFWLGLNKLYKLTTRSQVFAQLRFDMDNGAKWAQYDTFAVGGPETNYTLTIGNYSGGNLPDMFSLHNGWQFIVGSPHCNWGNGVGWWYRIFEDRRPHYYSPFVCLACVDVFNWQNIAWTDNCIPTNKPLNVNIFSNSVEMKLRIKRYSCPF